MTSTAKYLRHLLQKKNRMKQVKVQPRQVGPDGGFNLNDFDLDAVPPPERSAFEIAMLKHFGPPIFTG